MRVRMYDPDNAFKLFPTWRRRIYALMLRLPIEACNSMLADLKAADPIEDYPMFLKTKPVALGFDMSAAAILPPKWAMGYRLKSSDAKAAVIYVHAKRNGPKPAEPAAVVLQQHNPWTMNTLPWEPNKREAIMVVRMVSAREVKKIEEMRGDELREVKAQLVELGKRVRSFGKNGVQTSVLRDMAFEVLRAEFGMVEGGKKTWRPAISKLRRESAQRIFMELASWIADPNDLRYSVVSASGSVVPGSVAHRIQRFQDLVTK